MAPQFYQLVMRSGPTPGKTFPLTKSENMIGRDTTNDIVINDPEISRKHARLVINTGGYWLEDQNSTNGTFVNGQRLMGPHSLRPGELIMLGETIGLVFETVQLDADATVMSSASQGAVAPPQPAVLPYQAEPQVPAPTPQPMPQPVLQPTYPPSPQPPQPAFSGQVPPGPAEPVVPPPEKKKRTNLWLIGGCGCLLIIACVVAVALIYIDTNKLWCNFFSFILVNCR